MICRTEALVLRGYRMSQSSKVAILFSQDYGKLRLSAKGARRPKSKFGASLEPMTWGIYTFYRRGDRDLQSLTEGDIRYAFGGLKKDYRRMVCGSSVCDLLDAITEDGGPNGLLYSAALEALRWTETVDEEALEAPMWGFQVRAAAALGMVTVPLMSANLDEG